MAITNRDLSAIFITFIKKDYNMSCPCTRKYPRPQKPIDHSKDSVKRGSKNEEPKKEEPKEETK